MGDKKKFTKIYREKITRDQMKEEGLIENFKEKVFNIIRITVIIYLIRFIISFALNLHDFGTFFDLNLVLMIINILDQLIFIVEIYFLCLFNFFLYKYFKYKKIIRIKKIFLIMLGNSVIIVGYFLPYLLFLPFNYPNNQIFDGIVKNSLLFLNQIHYLIYIINYNLILFTSIFICSYFLIKHIKIRIFLCIIINFTIFYLILNNFSIYEMFDMNFYIFSYLMIPLNSFLLIININYSKTRFNIKEYNINDFYLTIKGNSNKKRLLSFLEIEEIPKNLKVREIREIPRAIDKLSYGRIKQYIFYHLLTLAEELEQVAYEIIVTQNSIKLRFILSLISNSSENILKDKMMDRIEFFKSVYSSSFPGIKLRILRNKDLLKAWKDIIHYGDYDLKKIEKDILQISRDSKKIKKFLSILKITSPLSLKPQEPLTQIDQLINNLLSNKITSHFVTILKPHIKHDFDHNFNTFGPNILKNEENIIHFEHKMKEDVKKISQYLRHKESLQLWKCSIYQIIKSDQLNEIKLKIKKAKAFLKTVFSDSFKKVEIQTIKNKNIKPILARILMREPIYELILSSDQVIGTFHLPEKITPSLVTNFRIPNFDLPPKKEKNNNQIPIGEVLYQDLSLFPAFIDIDELRLNMFITGLIGMGKTEFSKNILINLSKNSPEVNWIVLEWKGDYANLIHQIDEPILVLPIGNEHLNFKLNLFEPRKSNPENHANKIFSIFKESLKSSLKTEISSYELSPQMEKITKKVLLECVKNKEKRNFTSFFEELKNYEKKHSINNRSIFMTIAAIENRFHKFINGSLRNILNVQKSNVNFRDLMNYKVVFDFSNIILKEGSKEDAILLMNIILKYVMDEALNRGPQNELKHLVIIEDAQYLVPSILRELPESTLGEDIPLLLRGVGESMISIATRPEISQDIIANSAVKISFRLTSAQDTSKISGFQNLNELQEKYLKVMPRRECLISTLNFPFPFRVKTFNNSQKKVSINEIFTHNYKSFINFNFFNTEGVNQEPISKEKEEKFNEIEKKLVDFVKYKAKTTKEIKNHFKNLKIEELIEKLLKNGKLKRNKFPDFDSNMGRYFIKYYSDEKLSLKNIILYKIRTDLIKEHLILENGPYFDFSFKNKIGIKVLDSKKIEERSIEIKEETFRIKNLALNNEYEKIIVILPLYEDLISFNNLISKYKDLEIFAFYFNYKQWEMLSKLLSNLNEKL